MNATAPSTDRPRNEVCLRFDGILFDSDGVLVDSLERAADAWDQWSATFSPAFDFRTMVEHGVPARDLVARLVQPSMLDRACSVLEQYEIDSADGTVALPGAVDLTRSLPPRKWAVVTSATRPLAQARLRAAEIAPQVLVTADDITNGKPHPEPYLKGAQAIGIEPSRCAVFEDAPAGVRAALAAGVEIVIGVGEATRSAGASYVINSLDDVTYRGGCLCFTPIPKR